MSWNAVGNVLASLTQTQGGGGFGSCLDNSAVYAGNVNDLRERFAPINGQYSDALRDYFSRASAAGVSVQTMQQNAERYIKAGGRATLTVD